MLNHILAPSAERQHPTLCSCTCAVTTKPNAQAQYLKKMSQGVTLCAKPWEISIKHYKYYIQANAYKNQKEIYEPSQLKIVYRIMTAYDWIIFNEALLRWWTSHGQKSFLYNAQLKGTVIDDDEVRGKKTVLGYDFFLIWRGNEPNLCSYHNCSWPPSSRSPWQTYLTPPSRQTQKTLPSSESYLGCAQGLRTNFKEGRFLNECKAITGCQHGFLPRRSCLQISWN